MILVELEKAIELIEKHIKEINQLEYVDALDAGGMLLAKDLYAPLNIPPFNRSPLDGYALIAEDTKGASLDNGIKLEVIDKIYAGFVSKKIVKKGQCIRIMTGAKMPEGSNCVIKQEDTKPSDKYVTIYKELKEYDNYTFEGEDIKNKDLVFKEKTKLNYIHIGVIASLGYKKVEVFRKPKIALFVTGDELCSLDDKLCDGKIYNSNSHIITARLKELGMEVKISEQIEDDVLKLESKINKYIDDVDLIITTGGVSVGEKDFIHETMEKLNAARIFWKIKMKPGTPFLFSTYKDKPILSLSGNPFAALATFELLGRKALSCLTKDKSLEVKKTKGILIDDFNKFSPQRRFIRAYFEDGKVHLNENEIGHSSGVFSSMIGCNCMIDTEKGNKGIRAGEEVNIVLL